MFDTFSDWLAKGFSNPFDWKDMDDDELESFYHDYEEDLFIDQRKRWASEDEYLE